MKQLTEELKFKINSSRAGIKKCKWDEIYDTEEELINDLFSEKVLTDEDTSLMYKVCKGYEFIKGFRKYYKKNGSLTEKQMTQLKRLASEIAYHVYCEQLLNIGSIWKIKQQTNVRYLENNNPDAFLLQRNGGVKLCRIDL